MSADLRGAAIVGADGRAAGRERATATRWGEAARGLLAAADDAGDEPASRVHVATEDGEAFALR